MRTALILLLLLALAAIPGSVIPQRDVDALEDVARGRSAHPDLTPVYEKLGLFSVFDSVWFSAIYILLMVSLVGCIIPRSFVYWRAMRAAPPKAPRNLTRLPGPRDVPHRATGTEDVHDRAAAVLKKRGYRVVDRRGRRGRRPSAATCARPATCCSTCPWWWCWSGFAVGSLFGYKGGVILVVGNGFSNNLTQYDDFVPGSLFSADDMEPFLLHDRRLRRRVAGGGPGAGPGARVHLAPHLPGDAGRRGARSTTSRSTTRWPSATPRCS